MEDRFDELVKELNLDEVEDFEAKPAHYDVYIYNYDDGNNIMDESTLFVSYSDPDRAINKAKELVADLSTLYRLAATDAAYVSVEVETTVEREDVVENVGTLFAETVEIDRD